MAEIIQHPSSGAFRTPLGHSIRTGESSYRQLEMLYAENRLPVSTAVVDASKARYQREFMDALSKDGVEIILDTKCAELSEPGRFEGYAKGAPWCPKDEHRPLFVSDFQPGANTSVFGPIARLAAELKVDAIYAPTHYLRQGAFDSMFEVDIASLFHLRAQLDREGSEDIAIDYNLILPNTALVDEQQQEALVQRLAGLPFDNLVLRLSGFGAHAGHLTMKRTFKALTQLSALGKPIVIDHVGGLIALAAVAFNYASGTVHGIGERERFDARDWHKTRPELNRETGFGRASFYPVPDFDRSFRRPEIELIKAQPGGRRHLSCLDRACCGPQGLAYLDNPKAHIARQAARALEALSAVPNSHRAEHFMNTEMRNAERKARDLAGLETGSESVDKRLSKASKRIDSLSRTFDTLIDEPEQAREPISLVRRARYRRPA